MRKRHREGVKAKKRVTIVLLAAMATVGVFLLRPESDAHAIRRLERQYLKAALGRQWHERCWIKLQMLAGRKPNFSAHVKRQEDRLKSCERELVRLGHFEERTFMVRSSASVVLSSIMNDRESMAHPIIRVRGSSLSMDGMTIMNTNGAGTAVATVRIIPDHALIVLTARQHMEKWEDLIRDAEARQMTNRTLLIKAPRKVPDLEEMLHELETQDRRY